MLQLNNYIYIFANFATYIINMVMGVVVLTAGMLLIKLTFSFPHRLQSNSNSSTVFCFTEQNSNSVSLSPSQCCGLLEVLLSRFSSGVDVVLGEFAYHKFRAHHY